MSTYQVNERIATVRRDRHPERRTRNIAKRRLCSDARRTSARPTTDNGDPRERQGRDPPAPRFNHQSQDPQKHLKQA
jgi:hypothetical protein